MDNLTNFIQYDAQGKIDWVFHTNVPDDCKPDEGGTFINPDFYNTELIDCLYDDGDFFEILPQGVEPQDGDAVVQMFAADGTPESRVIRPILDPANYKKPVVEAPETEV